LAGRFFLLLALIASLGMSRQVRAEVSLVELVEQAGAPKVFYAEPQRRDSLIALLAGSGEARVQELLHCLDTPWAIHFEVIRRALESIGDHARQAVIRELGQKVDSRYTSLLLVVFENLGQPGDEEIVGQYLNSTQGSLIIPAARCLAQFGRFEGSSRLLGPLLTDSSAHVRLAAVWALGNILVRESRKRPDAELEERIRLLLSDPLPQIRYQAAETLRIISDEDSQIPLPLKPDR
jgi:hypothetical protein